MRTSASMNTKRNIDIARFDIAGIFFIMYMPNSSIHWDEYQSYMYVYYCLGVLFAYILPFE